MILNSTIGLIQLDVGTWNPTIPQLVLSKISFRPNYTTTSYSLISEHIVALAVLLATVFITVRDSRIVRYSAFTKSFKL